MTSKDLNKKLEGFKAILGFIADPVVVLDATGKILAANNILGKYTQATEYLINKNIFDLNLLDEKQAATVKENLHKRLQGNQIEPYEIKIKGKDNKEVLLEINAKPIKYEGLSLDVIVFRDVTKRAQTAITIEERFTGIAHSVKDAIVLVNEEAKITYWNPASETTFGYTSKEAVGRVIHELVVPPTTYKKAQDRIKESVKTFSETGIGYFTVGNVEVTAHRKDGSEFPAELSISPMRAGNKWHGVAVIKDITARKQANQKLKDTEQKYHMLFNQAPLGVIVVDVETLRFAEFNDNAHLGLGYTREEFEKITLIDIQVNRTPDQVRKRVKEMLENGSGEYQVVYKTKTGEPRTVIVTGKAVKSHEKMYLHCIAHDITENKKIQDALIESEARFGHIVEVAQEGIWAIDNELVTTFINPYMAKLLGYNENEIMGKKFTKFLDANWIEKITSIIQGFTSNNLRNQYEYTFPRKNGGHLYTIVTLSVVTDTEGQKIGTLAVVSDITKRKQLENDLRASEERFRAISTSALDAIILSDKKDQILYWNPAAEKIFGYSQKEVLCKRLVDLMPATSIKKHTQMLNQLDKGPISRGEFGLTALRKDGSTFPIDLSVVSVKLQEQNCLLAIVKDITEWKAMEEKLRQERDKLESVAMSTNIILATINRDYRITWVNQKGNQSTKYESLENQLCYKTFGRGSPGVCEGCGIKRVFENNESLVRRDYTFIDDDGKERWAELISTPIKDKNGYVYAALEISIDITERKRLQNKLAEYSQRLEEIVQKRTDELKKTQAELVKSERLAAIGELAGMIGHDLRNPLTGIKNSAYFLKKKGYELPPDQTKEMLETIDKCVDYSNRIINDLLDYSREIHLTIDNESPMKLLEESLALINIPKEIQIKNQLKETQKIQVDIDKIKRVFINLIKNAIEAMPEGGEIIVSSRESKEYIEICFTDTGVGINEVALSKLFTPLFTTKAQGMGFGLAICKRVIEAHKGTISVKTVKGQGTSFTLTLPINQKLENGGEKVWIKIPES